MPDNDQLGDKLVQLAEGVLDDLNAGQGDTKPSLDQRIDGLKAVGSLYLGLKKHIKEPEPDDDTPSLRAMRERVRVAEGEGK
jgi:hypothetical protein